MRAIEENAKVDAIRAEQYTVGQWMDVWFENSPLARRLPMCLTSLSAIFEAVDFLLIPFIGITAVSTQFHGDSPRQTKASDKTIERRFLLAANADEKIYV